MADRLRDRRRLRLRDRVDFTSSSSAFLALFFSYRPMAAALVAPAAKMGSACLRRFWERERSPLRVRDLLRALSIRPATVAPASPASTMRLLRWEELPLLVVAVVAVTSLNDGELRR